MPHQQTVIIIVLFCILFTMVYILFTVAFMVVLYRTVYWKLCHNGGFLDGSVVKNPPASAREKEMQVPFLSLEHPLEEKMATHSSILVWEIPWTEKPGRQKSTWSQRV